LNILETALNIYSNTALFKIFVLSVICTAIVGVFVISALPWWVLFIAIGSFFISIYLDSASTYICAKAYGIEYFYEAELSKSAVESVRKHGLGKGLFIYSRLNWQSVITAAILTGFASFFILFSSLLFLAFIEGDTEFFGNIVSRILPSISLAFFALSTVSIWCALMNLIGLRWYLNQAKE